MPTSTIPPQPQRQTVVPQKIGRLKLAQQPTVAPADLDRYFTLVCDCMDGVLSFINATFAPPPATKQTAPNRSTSAPLQSSTQIALQSSNTLVRSALQILGGGTTAATALTQSRYAITALTKGSTYSASTTSNVVCEGQTDPFQMSFAIPGSVVGVSYAFVSATPTAGSVACAVYLGSTSTTLPYLTIPTAAPANVSATYPPGKYPYSAAGGMNLKVQTSSGFAMASGGIAFTVYLLDNVNT